MTILSTPGHTPGHQSVLIESAEGRVVLAGQAVWALREFVEEQATVSNVFSDGYFDVAIDSIRRIKALEPETVYFAHCAAHRTNDAPRTSGSRPSARRRPTLLVLHL